MALHNIKIVVVDGGKSGSYKSKNAGLTKEEKEKAKKSPLYNLLHLKENIKEKVTSGATPAGVMALNMGMHVVGQIAKSTFNYYVSDIGRKNGDSNYQAMINRQQEIISDYIGFGSGLVSGAATGSMFGVGGAVIGAVLGAASSAISTGFRQAERQREYQHTMFENNTSQAYKLARANYCYSTGRLR